MKYRVIVTAQNGHTLLGGEKIYESGYPFDCEEDALRWCGVVTKVNQMEGRKCTGRVVQIKEVL